MIKAIIFDAGDILYRRRRNLSLLPDFLARFGLQPPDFGSAPLQQARLKAFAGEISRDGFFDTVLKSCGVAAPHLEEGRAVLDAAQAAIDFIPDVATILHDLKRAGLKLGIATNTYEPTRTKLDWFGKAGIADVWDSFATSCEIGLIKPNPGIYLAALSPLDIYPKEAAFVGHAEAEIEGARRLGLYTIAFNRDHDGIVADRTIREFGELAGLVNYPRRPTSQMR
jgi:HAD superfamily hydrolase (TIGR01509 family)